MGCCRVEGTLLAKTTLPKFGQVPQFNQRDGFRPSGGEDAVCVASANPGIFGEEHHLINQNREHTPGRTQFWSVPLTSAFSGRSTTSLRRTGSTRHCRLARV